MFCSLLTYAVFLGGRDVSSAPFGALSVVVAPRKSARSMLSTTYCRRRSLALLLMYIFSLGHTRKQFCKPVGRTHDQAVCAFVGSPEGLLQIGLWLRRPLKDPVFCKVSRVCHCKERSASHQAAASVCPGVFAATFCVRVSRLAALAAESIMFGCRCIPPEWRRRIDSRTPRLVVCSHAARPVSCCQDGDVSCCQEGDAYQAGSQVTTTCTRL